MNARKDLIAELASAKNTRQVERALRAYRWSIVPDDPNPVQIKAAKVANCWHLVEADATVDENGEDAFGPPHMLVVPAPIYRAMVGAAKGIDRD